MQWMWHTCVYIVCLSVFTLSCENQSTKRIEVSDARTILLYTVGQQPNCRYLFCLSIFLWLFRDILMETTHLVGGKENMWKKRKVNHFLFIGSNHQIPPTRYSSIFLIAFQSVSIHFCCHFQSLQFVSD